MEIKGIKIEDFDDVLYVLLPGCVYRFLHGIKYFPKEIKWFFQRRIRGYDDTYYWSMDHTLGKDIVKHLKKFNTLRGGHPGYMTEDEWDRTIKDMIEGFEYLSEDHEFQLEIGWHVKEEKRIKAAKKKAAKFIEHFGHLWY